MKIIRDGICNIALMTLHSYTNLIYLAGGKLLKELKMPSVLPYAELPTDMAGVQHAPIFDFNRANFDWSMFNNHAFLISFSQYTYNT